MKRSILSCIALCMALLLSACQVTAEHISSEPAENFLSSGVSSVQDSAEAVSSETVSSETGSIVSEERLDYLQSLTIHSAPVDLSDLDAVSMVYVYPLIPTGRVWYYSWAKASEIKADDLIEICSNNNFLNLPRDEEWVYLPEYRKAPAAQVETALQRHFDVDAKYLRTSKWYEYSEDGPKKENTYFLVGGFGGGWRAEAVSAEQIGNQLKIGIAIVKAEDLSVTPVGTLTVELTDKNVVRYLSYECTNAKVF